MKKQLEIPGAEDATRIPEVDEALYGWLDAKAAQRKAAETTKIKHASLLERLGALVPDTERYAYLDQFTGKKRFVVVKRDPKAATTNAPKPPKPKREPKERTKVDPAEQVEHRKVSRASVELEIDPFAKTRAAMEQGS